LIAAGMAIFRDVHAETLIWGATLGFHLMGATILAFSLALPDLGTKTTLLTLGATFMVVGNTGLLYVITEHLDLEGT
jgi:Ca2+/Na+ antiporter